MKWMPHMERWCVENGALRKCRRNSARFRPVVSSAKICSLCDGKRLVFPKDMMLIGNCGGAFLGGRGSVGSLFDSSQNSRSMRITTKNGEEFSASFLTPNWHRFYISLEPMLAIRDIYLPLSILLQLIES